MYLPAAPDLVKAKLELQSDVTPEGRRGWAATIVKVGKEAECPATSTKRFETGGIENRDLRPAGDTATWPKTPTSPATRSSLTASTPSWPGSGSKTVTPTFTALQSAEDKASTRPEDGVFYALRLYDSKVFNWYFEGPHDSQISTVLAKTNEGINIAVHRVSVWSNCHAYGNAEYAWELAGATLHGCIGEGQPKPSAR